MLQTKLKINPGAVVMLALICYCDNAGVFAVTLPAITVHELGHYAALHIFGCRLRSVNVGAFGLEMDYLGALTDRQLRVCAAAGPASGLIYAALILLSRSRYCQMSGTVSLLLSAFNLLPILPLDGGRVLETLIGIAKAKTVSKAAALLMLAAAAVLTGIFGSWTLLVMAVWLIICNFRA